jgi:hypothetical protein
VAGVICLAAEEHAMTYGPAKRRDIARSVLPSTDRKAARRKLAAVKRRSRRAVRSDLRSISRARRAEPVVVEYDGARFDPRSYPDAEIRRAVRRRRSGDKLGPIVRWAKVTTLELPIEDRLPAARALLAGNVAGRHAVGHLAMDDHFRMPNEPLTWWDVRWLELQQLSLVDLRALTIRVLEDGDHAELNRQLKAHRARGGEVRVLYGWHDVDAFVEAVSLTDAWRRVLFRFGRA